MAREEMAEGWIAERLGTVEFQIEEKKLDFVHEVWRQMQATGVSKAELARRIGCSRAWVTQLLDANTNPTLETMVKLSAVLGAEITVQLKVRPLAPPKRRDAGSRANAVAASTD